MRLQKNASVPQRKGSERSMEGKARFVFPVVITAIIVPVVSGALTFFDIGWRNDFVIRWWSAFAIGWPTGASTAFLAMPFARNLPQRIVPAIEQFRPAGAPTPASPATCTTQKVPRTWNQSDIPPGPA